MDDDGSGSGPTVSHGTRREPSHPLTTSAPLSDNLWRVLRSLGYKPTAREYEDMVLGMDRAKTGGIIFADFVLGMGAYMRPVDDAGALRDVFRKITHARVSGDDAQPRSYFDADDLAQVGPVMIVFVPRFRPPAPRLTTPAPRRSCPTSASTRSPTTTSLTSSWPWTAAAR